MEKYITYFDTKKNIFVIDKTRIILNDWNRPCIYGGYIINKDFIYNTLEDAIKSLKNSNYCITKEAEN